MGSSLTLPHSDAARLSTRRPRPTHAATQSPIHTRKPPHPLAQIRNPMRNIPPLLFQQVLDLIHPITNAANARVRRGAHRRLRTFYQSRLGNPDPFITETLAYFTKDPSTAALLYRLAIQQSAAFHNEDIYTKQIGLARTQIEIGNLSEALALLEAARTVATRREDTESLAEIDALLERHGQLQNPST
jgi:hypothetical protein